MITRDQLHAMVLIRQREGNFLSALPKPWFDYLTLTKTDEHPKSDINKALRLAASGLTKDIAELVGMIETDPRLLLQAGNVVTRAGILIKRTTLYEFFLGEGDHYAAKQIAFGFANIPNGEGQRSRQYNRYKPYIEALAKQVESKQPTFDLKPLFEMIKKSSVEDIAEALNINDLNRTATRNTSHRVALAQFRKVVTPQESINVGMHYKHYTTLSQAFDLLDSEWEALSDNNTNYDKCRLVWRQIIGYLQRSLPAVDRFAFARAFDDEERTLNFKYANGSFPDVTHTGDFDLTGLGFDEGIFGRALFALPALAWRLAGAAPGVREFETHVEQKLQTCRTYATTANSEMARMHDCLKK